MYCRLETQLLLLADGAFTRFLARGRNFSHVKFFACDIFKFLSCCVLTRFVLHSRTYASSCDLACWTSLFLSFKNMLSSARIVSAVVFIVSFMTGTFCEIIWTRGVAQHVAPLFDDCTKELAGAASGQLTREGFADLVESISDQVIRGPFERLPLKYRSMFNAHACMKGRDCVGDSASILVANKEDQRLTCAALTSQISQAIPKTKTKRNETLVLQQKDTQEPIACMASGGVKTAMTCIAK